MGVEDPLPIVSTAEPGLEQSFFPLFSEMANTQRDDGSYNAVAGLQPPYVSSASAAC